MNSPGRSPQTCAIISELNETGAKFVAMGAAESKGLRKGLIANIGAAATSVRRAIEAEGDRMCDLHIWRLGPGHLGAIVSVATCSQRDARHYRKRLAHFPTLSHITVEVDRTV